MRKQHQLKPTTGQYIPKRFIFFDTETRQVKLDQNTIIQHLKLGYAAYCERQPDGSLQVIRDKSFTSAGELWSWVDEICYTRTTTYLIAHNIVFDLTVMEAFKRLPVHGWELESFYSKGLVSIFRWSKDDRKIVGLDSSNLFPGKLQTWGDRFDLPKLEIDFDKASDKYLLTYCQRDVEIMITAFESWFDFLDVNEAGSFKPTIASTAFNAWRHKHLSDHVHIHADKLAIELEREAYKGGRTECLFVGRREDGPFYYLDVNNMYGFVLQNYEYPARLWGAREHGDLRRLDYKLKRYAVIARVALELPEPIFPVKHNEHTCYPTGRIETTLTTPELKLALDRGWIKEVKSVSWYRKEKLFENYIRTFRGLRKTYQDQDKPGYEKIVKLLINGLYGKFGQRQLTQEKIGSCNPGVFHREQVYDLGERAYYDQIWLGGSIFRERTEGESYHSFPAIAAHVTAYARLYLSWFLKQIPSGHVFYMDTDSLIVDQRGYETLRFYIDPDTIGMLKVELESPFLEINAPKDYKMQGRTRLKGIKQSAQEIRPGVFEQWIWPGLNGIIRRGVTEPYTLHKTVKRRSGKIHSGIIRPSGWIEPFHFPAGVPVPRQVSSLHPSFFAPEQSNS